jgi:hypothetical protein
LVLDDDFGRSQLGASPVYRLLDDPVGRPVKLRLKRDW